MFRDLTLWDLMNVYMTVIAENTTNKRIFQSSNSNTFITISVTKEGYQTCHFSFKLLSLNRADHGIKVEGCTVINNLL